MVFALVTFQFTCLTNTRAVVQPQQENVVFTYEFDQTLSETDLKTCAELLNQEVDLEIKIRTSRFVSQFCYSSTPSEVIAVSRQPVNFGQLSQVSIAMYAITFRLSSNEMSSAVEKLVYRQFDHGNCIYRQEVQYDLEQIIVLAKYNTLCSLSSDDGVLLRISVNDFKFEHNTTLAAIAALQKLEMNCTRLDVISPALGCSRALSQIQRGETVNIAVEAQVTHIFAADLSVFDEITETAQEQQQNLRIVQTINYPISKIEYAGVDCFETITLRAMQESLELLATRGAQLQCSDQIAESMGADGNVTLQIVVSEYKDFSGRMETFACDFETFSFSTLTYYLDCKKNNMRNVSSEQCRASVQNLFDYPENASVQISLSFLRKDGTFVGGLRFQAVYLPQTYHSVSLDFQKDCIIATSMPVSDNAGVLQSSESMRLALCHSQATFLERKCVFDGQIVANYPSEDGKYVFPITTDQRNAVLRLTAGEWFGFLESKTLRVVADDLLISTVRPELWQAYLVLPGVLLVLIGFYVASYFLSRRKAGQDGVE